MKALGEWLNTYGEGVYGTRICEPYFTGEWAFTRKKKTVYAFRLYRDPHEKQRSDVLIPYTGKAARVEAAETNRTLSFRRTDRGLSVQLAPEEIGEPAPIARLFRITTE